MAFFALAECALAVTPKSAFLPARQRYGWDGNKNTRCPVLCLAPALGRRQVFLFLAAASRLVWLAIFEFGAQSRVYAADRHGGVCCYVFRRALLGGGQAVVKAKGIVACGIQSGVERILVPRQVTLLRRFAGSSGTPAAPTHNALRRVCVECAVGERVLHAQELVVGLLGPAKVRVVHGGFDVAG